MLPLQTALAEDEQQSCDWRRLFVQFDPEFRASGERPVVGVELSGVGQPESADPQSDLRIMSKVAVAVAVDVAVGVTVGVGVLVGLIVGLLVGLRVGLGVAVAVAVVVSSAPRKRPRVNVGEAVAETSQGKLSLVGEGVKLTVAEPRSGRPGVGGAGDRFDWKN